MQRFRLAILSTALCCAWVGPTVGDPCSQSLFRPAVSKPLGARPHRVVLADLNHDGILDAVLPMRESETYVPGNAVAVLMGEGIGGVGDGTFGFPTLYATGSLPQGIAVADFDGGGNLDLAVSNGASNSVSILTGTGNGTFGPPVNIPCGVTPYGIVAADLNTDNIPDLVVANNGVASVSVLMGQGGGAFAPAVSYPIADLSVSLEVADINHDNKPDVVATAYTQGMAVLLGNGNGTLQPAQQYSTAGQPYTVALADVDGDTHIDVLAGNQQFGGLAVLKGTGTGTFGAPTVYGAGWTAAGIALGDVDADGIRDIAVTNATGNAVILLKGQGAGGIGNGLFAIHSTYAASSYPVGIAIGELNADGKPDLVVAGYGSSTVITLIGDCVGPAPHLNPVKDVPNDNGGRVFVTWTSSSLDVPSGNVTQYRVWRRIPPQTALARLASPALRTLLTRTVGIDGASVVYWEALATLPAQRLEGYGYTAATTQDSMYNGNPYTAFFVSALTSNIDVFYSSNVDSGYSVDNLRPLPPSAFAAEHNSTGITLSWENNLEPDLAIYHLYRGATADFVPSESNRIASPVGIGYFDEGALGDQYYKLTAIDVHGNESESAMVIPFALVGVGDVATSFDLRGAVPNPSRSGILMVHLSLPGGSGGRLDVLDLAGRRVASRTLSGFAAGPQIVAVGEREPLPTGVYMIRLVMGERRKDMKAIVMR